MVSSLWVCMAIKHIIFLFVETPRKFITTVINLRGVSREQKIRELGNKKFEKSEGGAQKARALWHMRVRPKETYNFSRKGECYCLQAAKRNNSEIAYLALAHSSCIRSCTRFTRYYAIVTMWVDW